MNDNSNYPIVNAAPLARKVYDVTDGCGIIFGACGLPCHKKFIMEPEFLVVEDTNLCGLNRFRIPYGVQC